jgi:hypothetical protein
MRVVIAGAGGAHKTEASLARACRDLGHQCRLVDVSGLTRLFGPLARPLLRRTIERAEPEALLLTVPASSLGAPLVAALARRYPTFFWYFDLTTPPTGKALMLGRAASAMFVTCPGQVETYCAAGVPNVLYLPQAVDTFVDTPAADQPAEYRCDASFVGSGHYPHRHAVLRAVMRVCRLQIRGPGWEGAPADLPVAGGPVWGPVFAQVVRSAAISLGAHALPEQEQQRACASNRMWKVLGCGGFFLGQHVEGIDAFARDGEHCAWFRDAADAADQTRHYLDHPEDAARIAAAGRAHALAHHTYAHRIPLLLAGRGYTST